MQAVLQLGTLEAQRGFFGRIEAVIPIALVAKVLGHITEAPAAAAAQQHAVQIQIVADECAGNYDRLVLQRQQRFQLLLGLIGLAARQQLDHIERVRVERDRAEPADHFFCNCAVVGQRGQLFHLIFKQELILAAAGQQRSFGAGGKVRTGLLRPIAGHGL